MHTTLASGTVNGDVKEVDEGSPWWCASANKVVGDPRDCAVFVCSLARMAMTPNGTRVLELPPSADTVNPICWEDPSRSYYPSNLIFIRQAYVDIEDIIFSRLAALPPAQAQVRILLAGTSGTGKSFFTRYFVWHLLHPPATQPLPEAILWKHDQTGFMGSLYYQGHFYVIQVVDEFICTNVAASILNRRNCWIIWDGRPPVQLRKCKSLVVSSPGKMYSGSSHIKKYNYSADISVYNPPWSLDELTTVATDIYGLAADCAPEVTLRLWKVFGGLPRYVLNPTYFNTSDPVTSVPVEHALNTGNIMKALQGAGSKEIDHQDTSGILLHLVPGPNYTTYQYQWGSTELMLRAFRKAFLVTKTQIQCFLGTGENPGLGTLYGQLFEPWFHSIVTERGYTGRLRKLEKADDGSSASVKRNFRGIIKTTKYKIPLLSTNRFHLHSEIQPDKYNIPVQRNFPAIDSLCPNRGEMFQVTSAEDHGVKAVHLTALQAKFKKFREDHPKEKVKLIFVIPPHNFEKFRRQRYIGLAATDPALASDQAPKPDPPPKKKKSYLNLRGAAKKEPLTAAVVNEPLDPSTAATANAEHPDSWIEQYALEMDVNPLQEALTRQKTSEGTNPAEAVREGAGATVAAVQEGARKARAMGRRIVS